MSTKSKNTMYIVVAIVVIVIVVAGVLGYIYTRPSSSSGGGGTQISIYGSDSPSYGFGSTSSSISSPGPTLTFTAGEKVTVTFHNVGTMGHNWAIVSAQSSTANVLWGAQIGSSANPVSPGSSASVTFTVGSAGNYYYICQVDNHVGLGMYGSVTVT